MGWGERRPLMRVSYLRLPWFFRNSTRVVGRVPRPAPLSASEQDAHIRLCELHGKVGIFISGGERNPVMLVRFAKIRGGPWGEGQFYIGVIAAIPVTL